MLVTLALVLPACSACWCIGMAAGTLTQEIDDNPTKSAVANAVRDMEATPF